MNRGALAAPVLFLRDLSASVLAFRRHKHTGIGAYERDANITKSRLPEKLSLLLHTERKVDVLLMAVVDSARLKLS